MDKVVALLLLATTVAASTAHGRAHHGCALVKTTLYCYGGVYPVNVTDPAAYPYEGKVNNIFNSLDLSRGSSYSDLQLSWQFMENNVGANYLFAMAVMPDNEGFMIDGGYGEGEFKNDTKYVTSIYHANNTWTSYPVSGNTRPLFYGHNAIGGSDLVYLSGGRTVSKGSINYTFPDQMNIYNSQNNPSDVWSTTGSMLLAHSPQTRLNHKGAFLDNKTIYYIGGIYPTVQSDGSTKYQMADMADILTYDTSNGAWGSVTTNRTSLPASRMDHTVTRVPGSKEMVVFGGRDINSFKAPLKDYLYVLNTDELTWRIQQEVNPDLGPGPRFGHSATLAGKNIFIAFGANEIDVGSEIYALNTTSWSWLSIIPPVTMDDERDGPVAKDDKRDDPVITPPPLSNQSNTGTIVGAVVGSVVGVGIIIAIGVFFLWRKRRLASKQKNGMPDSEVIPGLKRNKPNTHELRDEVDQEEKYGVYQSQVVELLSPSVTKEHTPEKPDGSFRLLKGSQRQLTPSVKPDGAK